MATKKTATKKSTATKKAPVKKAPAKKAPTKAKAAVKLPTDKSMLEAASDLQNTMKLTGKDKIEMEATGADLAKAVVGASELIRDDDTFEDNTWAVLKELGVVFEDATEEKPKAKPKATTNKPKAKGKKPTSTRGSAKYEIYRLWKKGKGTTDPEELNKKTGGDTQIHVIKGYMRGWLKGRDLPAQAK